MNSSNLTGDLCRPASILMYTLRMAGKTRNANHKIPLRRRRLVKLAKFGPLLG
jgi:hypothetical protein